MSLKQISISFFLLLLTLSLTAQETNKDVVAKIKTEQILDIITISGTAQSKTQVIKSLRYVMYLYKKNPETSNINKSEQSGRFVLQPNDRKVLSKLRVNQNTKDKITVLLLVYDANDKLVAKDRLVVLNDDNANKKVIIKKKIPKENDFAGFRGIVIEDTKTKPGRDFYVKFFSQYRLRQINGKEIVKITEQFSFGRNTIMEVSVGNVVVHRFFTQPTRDFIIQQSKVAINAVTKYFLKLDNQKNYIKQY